MQRVEAQKTYNSSPLIRYIFYGIASLLLAILHMSFLHWISVSGIAPDLLLLLAIWIGVAEGRLPGIFGGFLTGVLLDLISGDVLGTNALSKTIAGFIAGYFYSESATNKTLASFKLLGVIALASFIHNCIYFFFYVKPTEIQYVEFFMKYGLASTLYTTVAGIFPMLFKRQQLVGR
jgi:rod shape-determining protein MreD